MTWSSPKYRREKMIETVIPHYFSFGVYSKPICQAGLICCTWRPWRGLRRAAGSVIGLRIFLAVDGLNLGHPKCCSVQLQNWRLLNPKKMKSPYYIIIYIYIYIISLDTLGMVSKSTKSPANTSPTWAWHAWSGGKSTWGFRGISEQSAGARRKTHRWTADVDDGCLWKWGYSKNFAEG